MITQEDSELLYTTFQKDCKYTQTFAKKSRNLKSISMLRKSEQIDLI